MPRKINTVTCFCGRTTDYPVDSKYCSYVCQEQQEPKEKKPPSTGSKERKARIRSMEKNFTTQDWQRCLEYFQNKCAYCGSDGDLQQEHFIPVNDGGTYTPDNIIPACAPCNSRKQRKDPFDYLVVQERRLREYLKIEDYFASLKVVEVV